MGEQIVCPVLSKLVFHPPVCTGDSLYLVVIAEPDFMQAGLALNIALCKTLEPVQGRGRGASVRSASLDGKFVPGQIADVRPNRDVPDFGFDQLGLSAMLPKKYQSQHRAGQYLEEFHRDRSREPKPRPRSRDD